METAIVWFRRDLRVRDLPALAEAARAPRCIPVFVLDDRLLRSGRFPSPARTSFMLGCLRELDRDLRGRGGRLVIRHGRPEDELPALARLTGARDVFWTADVSPFAVARDRRVAAALGASGVAAHALPGAYVLDDPGALRTGQGRPYTVFSPFARAWRAAPRRPVLAAPRTIHTPAEVPEGALPASAHHVPFAPGEHAARRAMHSWLRDGLSRYGERRDAPAGGSSRLSPYLRWGCISSLELEQRAAGRAGAGRFVTELAWRDFYASVLVHHPRVAREELQERYRRLEWSAPSSDLDRWKEGRTGYPLVDAGMRQLLAEGWMHNRVRMVTGSFLTKDLHLDWRLGEAWFMRHLVDGDVASNNGGWQWIAGVGTDPAPYFQRLFNPVTQQRRFDPEGEYVRRWIPELRAVPDARLAEPWTMTADEQHAARCVVGVDYPAPIVDHAVERRHAIERYRAVAR